MKGNRTNHPGKQPNPFRCHFHTGLLLTPEAKITFIGEYDPDRLNAMAEQATRAKGHQCQDGPVRISIRRVEAIAARPVPPEERNT